MPDSEWTVFKTRLFGHLKTRATVSAENTQHPARHEQEDA
jgi:hypothetical protein